MLSRPQRLSHLHERKPARQPGVAIHDDMNLHHLSVGFEQPPKLIERHLRTQVSNKEVFHDVSLSVTVLIVGCSRAIGQEAEVTAGTGAQGNRVDQRTSDVD